MWRGVLLFFFPWELWSCVEIICQSNLRVSRDLLPFSLHFYGHSLSLSSHARLSTFSFHFHISTRVYSEFYVSIFKLVNFAQQLLKLISSHKCNSTFSHLHNLFHLLLTGFIQSFIFPFYLYSTFFNHAWINCNWPNDKWSNIPHYIQTEINGRGPCEPSLTSWYAHYS